MPRPVILGSPRHRKPQAAERFDALGADQIILPTQSVVTNADISVTTVQDIYPGDTTVFFLATRGGTVTNVSSIAGLPPGCSTEILRFDNVGSPCVALIRIYWTTFFPVGSGLTFSVDGLPTRKAIFGQRYPNLPNQPTIAWNRNTVSSTTAGTVLPTQAVIASQLPAIHVGAFAWGGATVPQVLVPGVDEEGTLDNLGYLSVGATNPVVFIALSRDVLTGPHASLTLTATNQTLSSNFVAVHAVWSTVAVDVDQSKPRPRGKTSHAIGPFRAVPQYFDIIAAANGATIGQALETDSNIAPLAHAKAGTLNQALETDTAQPLNEVHRVTLGQALETDSANAFTHSKRATLNQALETDTSQHDTAVKRRAITQPSETDTAQILKPLHVKVTAQATETDTANAFTHSKRATLGQATETDTAQHDTAVHRKTVTQPSETDTAGVFTPVKGAHVINQTTETDTANTLQPRKRGALLQALSTEIAQIFRAVKTRLTGKATETDTAQPFTHAKVGHANQATETDTAQTLQARKRKTLGQVVETDSAQVFTHPSGHTLNQTTETDTARPFTGRKTRQLAQASTTDTAQPFRAVKLVPIGRATDTSTAGTTKAIKRRILNQVSTTDTAQVFSHSKRLQIGRAIETDIANTLTRRFPVVYPPPSGGKTSAGPVGSGGTQSSGGSGRTSAKVVE